MRKMIATLAVAASLVGGSVATAPAGAAATHTAAATHAAKATSSSWGFSAEMWQTTIADPAGVYWWYYYDKCNPTKKNRRYFKSSSDGWLYVTYQCWVTLS